MKTPEQRHWRGSRVFIVNFEYISHLVLAFLFLTLSKLLPAGRNIFIKPFLANVPILYPPENTMKPLVFWFFQGA